MSRPAERPTRLNWRKNPPRVVEHNTDQIDYAEHARLCGPFLAQAILRRRQIQPSTATEERGMPTASDRSLPAAESATIPASTDPSPDLFDRSVIAKGAH